MSVWALPVAQSSKNDAIEQRDAAEAQVTQLQQELETAQANVAADDAAHIKCEKAATDTKDLIAQHRNLWADYTDLHVDTCWVCRRGTDPWRAWNNSSKR